MVFGLFFAQQLTHYLEGQSVDWLWLVGTVLVVLVGKAILTKLAEKQIYQASAELRLSMRRAVMEKSFSVRQQRRTVTGINFNAARGRWD
ncbi:hypothetical protein AP065_04055 [Listeria monocytogenes]|nr:hypothetical protein AP065_04055 [Listeria monocytogenes]